MTDNSFLGRIARAYASENPDSLKDYCFVFPNKRSGTFFRNYLLESVRSSSPMIEPDIITISDFISKFSPYVQSSRYDLLFTLYKEYSKLTGNIESFDRFVFWGDMLISDFNDVDSYLVDPSQLFRNVKDLREINADFLTDEQKEIIKKYWDIELPEGACDRFWSHMVDDEPPRDNRDAFIRLWEVLEPLYHAYRGSLKERGLSYSGMEYRETASILSRMSREEIPYSRIIFIGFNVLSSAEISIFERLKTLGIADFYWDYDFPVIFKENTSASHFIRRYIEQFPSIYDISVEGALEMPKIEIISVPSNTAQTKVAGLLLERMVADDVIADPSDAIDTAVVLPSEELFIELLHSLPDSFSSINITMGYPLKLTPTATLLRNITSLHLRTQKVRDEMSFFFEDVHDVVSHPLLRLIDFNTCHEVIAFIEEKRMFTIPVSVLAERFPSLKAVFTPIDDLRSGASVFGYLMELVDFLIKGLMNAGDEAGDLNLERGFLLRFRQSVKSLQEAVSRYRIDMQETTYLHLLEKVVSAESVNFIGEPLKGLQVMGVLETRALDFDNIIMLSMSERIFPRKLMNRSFIPNSLRSAYGMATSEFQECIFAYYFYRLISRAKNVCLVYDNRVSGVKGGEMSRYLYQLLHTFPQNRIKVTNAEFDLPSSGLTTPFEIRKDDEMMNRINRYLIQGPGGRTLSPSSINEYFSCPLKFYFHYIEKVNAKDEINDFMDEGTFGSIVHLVAEQSYKRVKGDAEEVLITREVLESLRKEHISLRRLVTSAINELYNHLPSEAPDGAEYVNLTPLQVEAGVVGDIVFDFVNQMFLAEMNHAPFYFVEGEQSFNVPIPFDDNRCFNLRGTIDRIDRLENGTVRIVDYKTGSDEIAVGELDELFPIPDKKAKKGVLQLFLYCNAYARIKGYDGPIVPRLFLLKKIYSDGLKPITIGKSELVDYRDYNDEVMTLFREKISTLFDKDVPFTPSPEKGHCKYCLFKILCGLAVE